MKKFTFKKSEEPKGLERIGYMPTWDIKLDKKVCGCINSNFSISLMVIKKDINEAGNPNCVWKWVKLKHKPSNEFEAKTWLNNNFDLITRQIQLFYANNRNDIRRRFAYRYTEEYCRVNSAPGRGTESRRTQSFSRANSGKDVGLQRGGRFYSIR